MNTDLLRSSLASALSFSPLEIVIQTITLILLTSFLSSIYVLRGNSLSNRTRLAALLPMMALTTMLIISIVKSSLALSLGLVGALSIVRFRAAIKDPEELVYIFLAISLGLGFGASQISMTTTFYFVIVGFILFQSFIRGKIGRFFTDKDSVHLEIIFKKHLTIPEVTSILDKHTSKIKLTRFDHQDEQSMMFLIKPKSLNSLEEIRDSLTKLDPNLRMTILQYQPLI